MWEFGRIIVLIMITELGKKNNINKKKIEMKKPAAKPFSDERMVPIIAEFKEMEYESGITKRQVFAARNLVYLTDYRQQFVTVYVEGMGRMSFHEPDTWIGQEVKAYLYYELLNQNEDIASEKLREQIFYRIIKNKLHVGIKPGAEYELSIVKNDNSTDCIIKVEYYVNNFCPEFYYFVMQLDKIAEIIGESLLNPNTGLSFEEVGRFLSDGEEKNFYSKDDDEYEDDSSDDDDDYRDEYEREYRSRSMEEQGYDDYDYIYGRVRDNEYDYEPEYDDDDDDLEHQAEKQHERMSPFFYYATVNLNSDDNEILSQE